MGSPIFRLRLRTNRIKNTGASQAARGMLLAPLENISSNAAIATQIHERDSAKAGRSSRRGNSSSCDSSWAIDVGMMLSHSCRSIWFRHQAVDRGANHLFDQFFLRSEE